MRTDYSIGEAAALTGVKAVTLRAWESRYGLVAPGRSDSAYRRYNDHDIELVRRMRLLVDSGVPARRAAAMTLGGATDEPDRPSAPVGGLVGLQDTAAIARAGAAFDAPALRRILDEAFAMAETETVVDLWLMPSMREVGAAWERGELDVASEHFISSAVMRKLSALFEATPARGPRVVVGMPADSRHELPALAFALLLQRAGAEVLYVGADVPLQSWTRVVDVWKPRSAVIAATSARDIAVARAAAAALAADGVDPVYIGGAAAGQVEGTIPVPDSLATAAQVVAAAVRYRHA